MREREREREGEGERRERTIALCVWKMPVGSTLTYVTNT